MSIVVGTLTIDLAANTASFASSMDKMSQLSARTANDIKRSLEKIAVAGAAMAAAIATGTAALIRGAIDSADELGKMAQSAGTSSETLSTLGYAARLSGLQMDQLGNGLVKLSKAAFQAQNGNVQLEKIFGRLGVSVTDSNGNLKDSGILLGQIATKFAGASDGAGKTALALALFGKSGAALIPFLNQYGAEQERVNAEAREFGLVLSTSTTEVAAKAHDNLMRLKEIFQGVGYAVLGATLPSLVALSDKLIQIAKDANIPDLARAFGEKVVSAVTILGNALDFATQHAHALKVALEALAGLKIAAIAIPIIGDLQKGGIANVGKGLDKLTVGFLGLERVLPVLSKFGTWVADSVKSIALLASEEGIASAASYVLGGAIAAMGGPIGIAIAAIAGIGIALYKFRDATFTVKGQTYELRDTWNAAWIEMKDAMHPVGDFFSKLMGDIKRLWSETVDWIKQNSLAKSIIDGIGEAAAWVKAHAGSALKFALAIPSLDDTDINALNRAKAQREGVNPRFLQLIPPPAAPAPKKPPPFDTSGLGKPKKDIFGDEVRKLDLAIQQQRAYLAVLDGTPEKLEQVAAAEKARGIIVELNNRLIDEGRAKLTAHQEAILQQKVATEQSLKALDDYGKELVAQQHGADLSIQQTRAMAAANLEGDAAIRQTAIDNAILGLTFYRTAEQIRAMTPELAKLRTLLTAKASTDLVAGTNKEIDGLRDQLAERQMVNAAILESIDVQRQAALASKLYPLNQNIAEAGNDQERQALVAKRDAIIALTQAEWAEADAQAGLALRSPTEQYQREVDALNHAAAALAELQGGSLTYGQQLQASARMQDEFNKATDDTVALRLREGSAADGVTAFFLEMQKQGKSTAATLYEAFNSAFGKISQGFTDVLTSNNRWQRKQAWNQFGQMFDDLGKQLLNSTISKGLQGGLGALGSLFGVNLGSVGAKIDGSTAGQALWVRMADGIPGLGGKGSVIPGLPGLSSGSDGQPGWLSRLTGGLFGGSAKNAPQSRARPASLPAVNELRDLAAGSPLSPEPSSPQPSPSSPQPPSTSTTSIFQSIPALLRQGAAGAVLGASLLGAPAQASTQPGSIAPAGNAAAVAGAPAGGATVLPATPDFWPQPAPTVAATPAMPAAAVAPIGNPPDVQPKTFTQIAKPQSTLFDKILGAGITLAGNIGGSLLGGAITGGSGSSSAASSSGDSGAWAQAAQPGDNANDSGIVTIPMAVGGKVSGPGSGTSDSIPAMLSHGEYVINADATAKHLPLLRKINHGFFGGGVVPGFATGGLVGYDEGGFVAPNMAYLPGDRGSDMMASASAQVANAVASSTPGSSGDQHTWHIDARGNPDPAQTIAQTARMMRTAAPQIAASAVHAMKDQQLRRPPSAR